MATAATNLTLALYQRLTAALLDPAFHDYLAIIKGARNGLVYGIKVRFPHALVMSILFGHGTPKQRAYLIYKATKQHAFNLAKFVTIYKSTLLLLRKLSPTGKQGEMDTFWSGLLGGWIVFGNRNAVNEQIVLYVFSRVFTTLLPRAMGAVTPAPLPELKPGQLAYPPGAPYPKARPPHARVFEVYAAVTWGMVMYLFAEKRDRLQTGMTNSMQYLYLDSEVWNGWKTFLWC